MQREPTAASTSFSVRPRELWSRFWSAVKGATNPLACWPRPKNLTRDGYSMFFLDGKKRLAHRLAFEAVRGPIPEGKELDHLCRNPSCVNPYHLEPVSHGENVRRGDHFHRRKTKCPRGHPYSPENTYRDRDGWRRCRTCRRKQQQQAA